MDPICNPFAPGAGTPPPELAGRNSILDMVRILLQRIMQSRAEKSLLLTGLRGVGKTVLLNEIERMAQVEGYRIVTLEASEDTTFSERLYPSLRRLLFELDRMASISDKVKRSLAILRSFSITINKDGDLGLGIDPLKGVADSGDLQVDLTDLFIAIAEAAAARDTAVALLIDEIQYLSSKELGALIMAMHKIQQKQLPLILCAAGLPVLPGLAGEIRSYAERLFNYPEIGPLTDTDVFRALNEPAVKTGKVSFASDALREIFRLTRGYPYFVQVWGYQAWNRSEESLITLELVKSIASIVTEHLDGGFFRVRFNRLTPGEKYFLRAMADSGALVQLFSTITERLNSNIRRYSPVRAKLIKKGMIYSPEHGKLAFTVPLFDEFMRRIVPDFP